MSLSVTSSLRRTLEGDVVADVAVDIPAVDAPELYEITLTEYYLDECAIELGLYFVLLSICMFILLDELRGKTD
jgi:hypothetical protein